MRKNAILGGLLLILGVALVLVVKKRFEGTPAEISVQNASKEAMTVSLGPDPLGQLLAPGAIQTAPFAPGMSVKVWVGPKAGGFPGEWVVHDFRGTIEVRMDGGEVELEADGLVARAVLTE